MIRSTHSPYSEEMYLACPVTAVGNTELTEIGRIIVHYGLLVVRIEEFVADVSAKCDRYPVLISSKNAVKMYPDVVAFVEPLFKHNERAKLRNALAMVATANKFRKSLLYSSWGVSPCTENGVRFIARTVRHKGKNKDIRVDRQIFTAADLHDMAMQVSLAARCVGLVHGAFKRKIDEDSDNLLKLK